MLSPYAKSFEERHILAEKLVPNLRDKNMYVTHYLNLKLYVRLGMRVKRIHRVLENLLRVHGLNRILISILT